MVDRIRHYVIIYEQRSGCKILECSYTKFCTLKELFEDIGALYKDNPFIKNVRVKEITEAE